MSCEHKNTVQWGKPVILENAPRKPAVYNRDCKDCGERIAIITDPHTKLKMSFAKGDSNDFIPGDVYCFTDKGLEKVS